MSKEMVVSANPHETRVAILEDGLVSEVFFERERSYSLAGSIYKGRVTRILPGMQSAFVNIGLERDAFLYVSDFLEGLEEYDQLMNSLEERTPVRSREQEAPEAISPTATAEFAVSYLPVAGESAPPDLEGLQADSAGVAEMTGAAEPLPRESIAVARPPQSGNQGDRDQADRNRDNSRARDGGRGGRFGRRGRRGGQRGRGGFPDSKYARGGEQTPRPAQAPPVPAEAPVSEAPAAGLAEIAMPVTPILLPGESISKYRDWARPSDHPSELTPVHSVVQDIARDNAALQAEHEEEIEELAAAVVAAGEPHAPTMHPAYAPVPVPVDDEPFLNEPVEQEASEVLITPHAFVPRAFDPEAFAASDAANFTAEELAAVSEATLNEVEADAAGAGIDWESREGEADSEGDQPSEEGEVMSVSDAEVSGNGIPLDQPVGEIGQASADGQPRDASMREGGRNNARFQRRQRWQARRGGSAGPSREGGPRRDAGPRDQGRRPQRNGGPREGPREVPREGQRQAGRPLIGDMLKEGQEIIVQIAKEPLGKKGARITSHVALPGRYVVYMPTLNHVGVSRKVSSDEERQRLKRIVLDAAKNFAGGFIVRTAGDGHSEEDVRQDVQYLTKLWLDIKAKAEKSNAPSLLHHDPDLVLRTLRDQLSPEYTTIWVDNEQVYEQILLMVQKFQPALVGRVRLYTKEVPLFEETGVQEEINKALKPKVWLKSGGYIVINQTEALVAIDVNTGKFVGKSNRLEDTIVKTNLEAIQEIVRQIRLRDLGGIIVIDFIDMDERKNRAKVLAELEEAVKVDRSPSKILSFNEFGLVALTRKRVRQSLERALCTSCAYCDGSGMVKSPASVSLEILTEARKVCAEWAGKQVTIRVNPEVGKTLKSTAAGIIDSIEELTGKGVIIRNDPSVHMENFYFD